MDCHLRSPLQVLQKPLMERLQVFETLSNVELGPVLVFDETYKLNPAYDNDCWLYLTSFCMAQLEGRSCFYRRDELQRVVAQFVCLPDMEPHLLPQVPCCLLGTWTLWTLGSGAGRGQGDQKFAGGGLGSPRMGMGARENGLPSQEPILFVFTRC